MEKALIIGAGPAGLSSAYWGSTKDIKIFVYEKDSRDEIPTKPCGEAIPSEIFDYLPKDLGKDFLLNNVKRVLFYFNGEFLKELKNLPFLSGYIIDKHKFLLDFAEVVEAHGGKVYWGKKMSLKYIEKVFDEFDYIIDASGKGFLGRKFLSYKNYKLMPVIQAYAKGKSLGDDTLIFWGVDRGYGWIFPRGDRYNVGVGGVYRDPKILRNILKEMLEKFDLKLVTDVRGAAVSYGGPINNLVYDKIRVVGEAGGMVMPTTGEGIRFSVAAGKIVFEKNYEKLFWKTIGWRLKNGYKLLKILLRVKDKEKLGRIADDETYYQFFEGIYSYKKLLRIVIKYIF